MQVALVALAWVALAWGVTAPTSGTPAGARVARLAADFGIRLFREAAGRRGDGNAAFSPHGAAAVLGALQLATAGPSRHQIEAAMGFGINEPGVALELRRLRKQLGGPGQRLAAAEGLFVARELALAPGVITRFVHTLGRRPAQVDFQQPQQARAILNAWVQNHTQGMIRDFLPPGAAGPGTRLVLATAVYFKGSWLQPFPAAATRRRLFHKADGSTAAVPMMEQTAKLNYGEFATPQGLDYDVVELPYHGGAVSMLVAAPARREAPLAALAGALDADLVAAWAANMTRVPRVLVLPRFSLETAWDLRASLKALGVRAVFEPEAADFTALSAEEPLFLAQALQKVRIEVNESGTEAASATAAVVHSRMAPLEILMDRPFLFIVRHNPTGPITLCGVNGGPINFLWGRWGPTTPYGSHHPMRSQRGATTPMWDQRGPINPVWSQ
ncbi:plasminogen activator inhibitor 1 [Apteryx mantelli]|uniref:Plasminogen activator inhibitor 1 n=1 Tax=Apteryx mantelli TaxID=2696672 RepID=A0ABM4G1M9_9AVES